MNKSKPNISLFNLSEISQSGIYLALRKGLNELLNRQRNHTKTASPKTCNKYANMISVIICTADRGCLAENAVSSVLNQLYDMPYEIIVVNNSKNELGCTFPGKVKVINEPVPGLSVARNTGARFAKGEYLLYIDDDAVANDGLLTNIRSAFEDKRGFSIIGGQIFLQLPDPVPEVFLAGKEALWSAYTVSYKKLREIKEQYEFPYGACFAIRHSVLDILDGFPESYGRCGNNYAGGEETALCYLARKFGYKTGIEPNASVTHCVLPERFTKEHIKKTIRESILTTYRLYKDGYSPSGWTPSYADERLHIIEKELERLSGLELYYKECEYDAFTELKQIMS